MHNSGFLTCPADLYLWMKPIVRPNDGFNYYAYFLIYVDDVMDINHETESVISIIDEYFKLKPSSIIEPDIYLGVRLKKTRLENELWAW